MEKNTFVFVFFLVNLFLSSFFIDTSKTWNTTSRVLLVLSLTEDNNLSIDKYHWKTGDKGLIDEHYYSDKPPFLSFLVFPFYKLLTVTGIEYEPSNDKNFGNPVYYLGSL